MYIGDDAIATEAPGVTQLRVLKAAVAGGILLALFSKKKHVRFVGAAVAGLSAVFVVGAGA